jgi:hypothetical protein
MKITEFEDLITTGGTCYASTTITLEGMKVGYMYREEPTDEDDTGWRFYSGTEDDEFVDNPENFKYYDLNVIANFDRAIIPLLKKPIGKEWERIAETNKFQEISN